MRNAPMRRKFRSVEQNTRINACMERLSAYHVFSLDCASNQISKSNSSNSQASPSKPKPPENSEQKMPPPASKRPGPGQGLDPDWVAVDKWTFSTLHHPRTQPNHAFLERTLTRSAEEGLPPIYSSPTQGKFLALQCRLGQVKHALDIGTLGGYSAIWMASMNPGMRVTTFEYSEHHASVARKNFEEAGVADRIDLRVGPAAENLAKLLEEIEAGKAERVGFAFVDADKMNNWTYCDFAIRMGYPGTCICVDNIVQHGNLVKEEAQNEEAVKGARIAVENAGKDDRIESLVMQCVGERNYDGFLMAVVK